jgi:hypothetical protein
MLKKSLTFDCPACQALQVLVCEDPKPTLTIPCGACHVVIDFARLDQAVIEGCPRCGEHRLYQHKDFNKKTGLAVFLAGVLGSLVFYERVYYLPLLAALLIDAALYPLFPWMQICYRCETELRGWPKNPALDRFSHEIAAHFEYGREKAEVKSTGKPHKG